ncbi:MAG: hypothetical protein RL719_119, partial [Actinomycetota bacterium]
MSDEFENGEAAAQGENSDAAAAAASESADNAPVDPLDAELADLVEETG